jgi:hypothetical protein
MCSKLIDHIFTSTFQKKLFLRRIITTYTCQPLPMISFSVNRAKYSFLVLSDTDKEVWSFGLPKSIPHWWIGYFLSGPLMAMIYYCLPKIMRKKSDKIQRRAFIMNEESSIQWKKCICSRLPLMENQLNNIVLHLMRTQRLLRLLTLRTDEICQLAQKNEREDGPGRTRTKSKQQSWEDKITFPSIRNCVQRLSSSNGKW